MHLKLKVARGIPANALSVLNFCHHATCHLLELIPTKETAPEVIEELKRFQRPRSWQGASLRNDVPGFVANRVGVFSMVRAIIS